MDPDLLFTVAFGLEVVLFAVVGAVFIAREARRERAEAAAESRRRRAEAARRRARLH